MPQLRATLSPAAVIALLLLNACGGTQTAPIHTYPMGDKVHVGHLIYTAFETQWLTQIPQDPTPRVPQSRFFLVRISAVNSGSGDLIVPNVTIQDDRGKTYEELSNGDGVPQWVGYLRQAHPADSVQGFVVFDAPPAHYKMRVTDENGELAALIDIPLTFNAESPVVPFPGEKKDARE
ncbi:MAG TPA: hypothetical protein VGZ73_15870 [Bryobacteraceae bacterium]|jgi:hypothetical protein|nr:hypothetical protein [Bryobacteraceae bacterium]